MNSSGRKRIRCHFKKVTLENGLSGPRVEALSWGLLQWYSGKQSAVVGMVVDRGEGRWMGGDKFGK